MIITKERNNGSLTMKLEGRLDAVTSPLLEEELNTSLDGVNDLTFDFSLLEYLSSAGFRVLIIAYKKMYGQGTLKVINANELVQEAFRLTRVSDIISIS
ncbi:MAG: STAS domain-containing protein [Clostridiales bacterium]|nr:STAS domain-containing protein [Clostridiales bacterium]